MSAERDIAFQASVEMMVANELARMYPGSFIQPNQRGKNSLRDFVLLRPLGVEVKCDYKAKTTRNLYFEVFNPKLNQPSGLVATKAWRWVHYVPGDAVAYVYCPKTMLRWLQSNADYATRKDCGDNNSDGYVIPLKDIAKLDFVKSLPMML